MTKTNIRGTQITDGSVDLTVDITNTLPVANGGTGAATLTGLVVGNGTSAMTTVPAPSGTVVGTTDTQTETNKTLSDTYMGEVFDAQRTQRDTTLLASNDFSATDVLEIGSGFVLEIPATSTLEVAPGFSKVLSNPVVSGYTENQLNIGTVSSAYTLNISTATVLIGTLTASTSCTFTMPPAAGSKSFVLFLNQAAVTGAGTATFTGVAWNSGGAPTMTTTAGAMDIYTFISNGTTWYGAYSQGYTVAA